MYLFDFIQNYIGTNFAIIIYIDFQPKFGNAFQHKGRGISMKIPPSLIWSGKVIKLLCGRSARVFL